MITGRSLVAGPVKRVHKTAQYSGKEREPGVVYPCERFGAVVPIVIEKV